MRLHATGGYCTVRHGLVPGMLLTLAAAHGITWLMSKVSIPGRWLGLAHERLRPGPAVWSALILFFIVMPNIRSLGPVNAGPFSVYRQTGRWLAQHTQEDGKVLDLTDWSLFFSAGPGYIFANVYEAPLDPKTRWIVVAQAARRRALALQQGPSRSDRRSPAHRAGSCQRPAKPRSGPDLRPPRASQPDRSDDQPAGSGFATSLEHSTRDVAGYALPVSGARVSQLAGDPAWVAKTRRRLTDLGWFMKCLKEPLARMANKEDGYTGAFWESRFRSIAVLDEESPLAAAAYIDLNPLAAGVAALPEESPYTSLHARIEHWQLLRPITPAGRSRFSPRPPVASQPDSPHWRPPARGGLAPIPLQ